MERVEERLWDLRQQTSSVICDFMGKESGGVLSAMLVGEDQYLDREWEEVFQKTGIGHLLAISALHVSFVGSGVYKGLRLIRCPRIIAATFACTILTGYVILSGRSISSVRAWIMFLVQMGAEITGREYDGCTALSIAAGVLLFQQPVYLLDSGFLLSFSAVFGIYVLAPIWNWKVPFAIQAMLLPIQLYSFYEVCPYSLLWNLLVIPLAVVLLGSGIFGIVFWFFGVCPKWIPEGCFWIAKQILLFYKIGSEGVLSIPGARWITGQPLYGMMVLYYLILGTGILMYKNKKWLRRWKILLLVATVFLLFYNRFPKNEMEISMINVGQGDCFFIQDKNGGTYMIDGGSSDVSKVGIYRIESFLKKKGVRSLDYVWITHGDSDHLSGIQDILEHGRLGIPIRNLILPPKHYWEEKLEYIAELGRKNDSNIRTMKKGSKLWNGKMKLQCVWPREKSDFCGNEASYVLVFQFGEVDILFTGDLEKEAELEVAEILKGMQEKGELPREFEVLKAGHHGSKHATGEVLLEVVKSRTVWISCGKGNRYGHPHQEVLERLAKRGINLYNTKDRSTVCLKTNGKMYCIECFGDGL